jgi:1-acyl-sn-glycerol-3-phosphate acyltransferase
MDRDADNPWIDRLARGLFFPYLAVMHRFRWHGAENVPRSGPAILAANHQSWYDPVLIGLAAGRRVTFLGSDYFYNMPVLGTLMRLAGTVPVDPDEPEPTALARMIRALEEGRLCGIFPEGGRTHDGLFERPKGGAATLALRTGAPLIPVTICGAHHAWGRGHPLPRPTPISLCFGAPLRVHRHSDGTRANLHERRRELTFELMSKMADGFERLGRPDLASACYERLRDLCGSA